MVTNDNVRLDSSGLPQAVNKGIKHDTRRVGRWASIAGGLGQATVPAHDGAQQDGQHRHRPVRLAVRLFERCSLSSEPRIAVCNVSGLVLSCRNVRCKCFTKYDNFPLHSLCGTNFQQLELSTCDVCLLQQVHKQFPLQLGLGHPAVCAGPRHRQVCDALRRRRAAALHQPDALELHQHAEDVQEPCQPRTHDFPASPRERYTSHSPSIGTSGQHLQLLLRPRGAARPVRGIHGPHPNT